MKNELDAFHENGYLIRRGLIDDTEAADLVALIDRSLQPALAPVEFEADVHYPGAPESRLAPGGHTPRRLLHAYSRDEKFQAIGRHPDILAVGPGHRKRCQWLPVSSTRITSLRAGSGAFRCSTFLAHRFARKRGSTGNGGASRIRARRCLIFSLTHLARSRSKPI